MELEGISFIEKNRLTIMCSHATIRMMMDCLGLKRVSFAQLNEYAGLPQSHTGGLSLNHFF